MEPRAASGSARRLDGANSVGNSVPTILVSVVRLRTTDGAGGEGINYVVPGASYVTAFGAERILSGLNPGSPKRYGLEIVSGRHLPDDFLLGT